MADTTALHGKNNSYTYYIHPLGTTFKNEPGNYAFAYQARDGAWYPTYVGETQDLGERLRDHDKQPCATKNGATHILAHITSGGESARLSEESDLISNYKPACNIQGK